MKEGILCIGRVSRDLCRSFMTFRYDLLDSATSVAAQDDPVRAVR
jgi:hypothetical protein